MTQSPYMAGALCLRLPSSLETVLALHNFRMQSGGSGGALNKHTEQESIRS